MELAIALLILVAFGFLYYGWIRLRQEAEAKARQLIFRKATVRAKAPSGAHTA